MNFKQVCASVIALGMIAVAGEGSAGLQPELAGEWSSSHGSTIGYVNPNTGSYAAPNGDRMHYRFFPDGRYIEAGLMQSSLYGCTMTVSGYKTGVYTVQDSKLTLDEKTYTFTSQDTCRREWNYVKHPPVSKQTYQWRLDQGQGGPKLVMTSEGKSFAYARVKAGQEILK